MSGGYSRRNQGTSAPGSRLQFWEVRPLGVNQIGIKCPNCGGKAAVNRKKWLKPPDHLVGQNIIGRACTYCFRAARIPDDA